MTTTNTAPVYVIAVGFGRWQFTAAKTIIAAKRAASALAGTPRKMAKVGKIDEHGVATVAIRPATYEGQRPARWE